MNVRFEVTNSKVMIDLPNSKVMLETIAEVTLQFIQQMGARKEKGRKRTARRKL